MLFSLHQTHFRCHCDCHSYTRDTTTADVRMLEVLTTSTVSQQHRCLFVLQMAASPGTSALPPAAARPTPVTPTSNPDLPPSLPALHPSN